MSDVNLKVKDALQELDFLNGEIGRVKGVKLSIEKEIEDHDIIKATKHKEFLAEESTKELKIQRLNTQIENHEATVASLTSDIIKLDLVLEDKRTELVTSNAKLKENEEKGIELTRLLEDRRDVAKTSEEKARIVLKELADKQISLDSKEKALDNKESSITGTISSLEEERGDVRKLKILLQEKIDENNELKRNLNTKVSNVGVLEKDYNEKLAAQKLQNEELIARTKKIEDTEIIVNSKLKDASILTEELDKQKKAIANKEADLILRERECRVREKTISVKEREQEIKE